MPLKTVTRLRKFCGLLAGHSSRQAERVTRAAFDLVRRWLPEDLKLLTMHDFQVGLSRMLEHLRVDLTEVDDGHMHELQIDRNLREDRDFANAEVRQGMLRLKDSTNGLFGPGGANKIFEETPIIPTDPMALAQLTGRVMANLGDPAFPMPKPLKKGFKLDREEAVRDLEGPYRRLVVALAALEATQSDSKYSQTRKDKSVTSVDVLANKAARFLEAFYDLVGLDGLSDRVRRSSRRAGNAEAGDPEAGDPEAGDPEAGARAEALSEPVTEPDAGDSESVVA